MIWQQLDLEIGSSRIIVSMPIILDEKPNISVRAGILEQGFCHLRTTTINWKHVLVNIDVIHTGLDKPLR